MWESRSIPGNTDIKTARLDLILFTPEQLAAVLSGAASSIEDAAQFPGNDAVRSGFGVRGRAAYLQFRFLVQRSTQ